MELRSPPHPRLDLPHGVVLLLCKAAVEMAGYTHGIFRIETRRRSSGRGATLRPGKDTPLWQELRKQLRPHLRQYGRQANLARLLGLPRQRVNSFITGGGQMPDAERTLQLLAWLMAVRQGRPPG